MRKIGLLLLVAALAQITSCIVSDQLTTIRIKPDGSASFLRFQSNIRSTETGEKGAAELAKFVQDFEAGRDSDCLRLVEAGGKILEARLVTPSEPYATLVKANLPNSKALEKYLSFADRDAGSFVRTRFVKDGRRRRLEVELRMPRNALPEDPAAKTESQWRREQADSVSEIRLALSQGRIVDSRGFTVASDRRSVLPDSSAIEKLLRDGKGEAKLFLEWEV